MKKSKKPLLKSVISFALAIMLVMGAVPMNPLMMEVRANNTFSGGSGTANDPYQISSIADMTALAEMVNADNSSTGNATKGKYFKLTQDITYGENDAFTPVGGENAERYLKQFNGTFDGGGYTISGIKIDSSKESQGLFGEIYENGTVKNVTVANADIKAGNYVGGIAGHMNPGAKLENCLIVNSNIKGNFAVGAVVGTKESDAVLNGNYYGNCSVKVGEGEAGTSDIGCGNGGGNNVTKDIDGAMAAATTASETFCQKLTVGGTDYYLPWDMSISPISYEYADGAAIAISPTVTFRGKTLEAGDYTISVKDNSGNDVTGNVRDRGIYTLTVSGVNSKGFYGSREFSLAVGMKILTEDTTELTTGTYGMLGDVTLSQRLNINGNVTLNLPQDCTLTAGKGVEVSQGNTLTIEGSGTLTATGENEKSGIGAARVGTVSINGGTVNATGGTNAAGIGGDSGWHGGNITINGGTVIATGGSYAAGIGGGHNGKAGNIVINGGKVTASGFAGIGGGLNPSTNTSAGGGSLNLGWTNLTNDFVQAQAEDYTFGGLSSVSFADGKLFLFAGTETQATKENINQHNTTVKIVPTREIVDLSNAVISGVNTHYAHNGNEIAVTPTVTLSGETLSADDDYTVSISRNGIEADAVKEKGTYTLTVTGKGGYKGSASTTFYVNDPVGYQAYENGALKDETLSYDRYARVTADTRAMTDGWYVVTEDVTISDRISTSGDVKLVLCNGAALTAQKGISVLDGNSLTIYGQEGNTGALYATEHYDYIEAGDIRRGAGIGGDAWGFSQSGETAKAGTITIHGGTIIATAHENGYGCACIGEAYNGGAGDITIYGGKVTATEGPNGTGIGGTDATITLGYKANTDFIWSSSYCGTVKVETNKKFVTDDETPVSVSGTVNDNAAISGKKLTPKLCTVSFHLGGAEGTAPADQKNLLCGIDKATKPTDPIRTGYIFKEWKNNDTGYDFSAVVTDDLTLTADWIVHETSCPHSHTELRDVRPGTCSANGYSGNRYCLDCGAMVEKGKETPKDPDNHHFDFNDANHKKVKQEPTLLQMGITTYTCVWCGNGTMDRTDIPCLPDEKGRDLEELREDVEDLSGNAVPKIDEKKDEKGNTVEETITIGGEEVSKIITDPESGKETVESKVWIGGLKESYRYTGSAIKPSIHVYDGTRKLNENTDYKVKWSKNKEVGTAEITVKFKGNYKDTKSETAKFEIKPAILGDDIIAHETGVAVKKSAQKPVPVLTWKETGKTVPAKNFNVTYDPSEVKAAGTYTATITSKNTNFDGTATALVKVAAKDKVLSNVKVKFDPKSYNYTGKPIEPKYSLTMGSTTLTKDKDYRQVSLTGNTNPGTATIIFEAISGNEAGYVGSKTATFKISGKKSLKDAAIDITCAESVPFAKGGAKAAVTVTDKDTNTTLKEGVDYTLSYSKNKAVGTGAEVKVKGKGNYKDTVAKTFAITKQSLKAEGIGIVAADQFTTKSKLKAPVVTITDIDGKKLKANTDYTVGDPDLSEKGNTEDSGIVYITITGRGNYSETGSVKVSFRYMNTVSSNIGKAKAKTIPSQAYTGNAVKLSKADLTNIVYTGSKGSENYLKPGTDFVVVSSGYSNNVKKGTAKVTIRGIGAYAGTKTLSFKIEQRQLDYKGALVGGGWVK